MTHSKRRPTRREAALLVLALTLGLGALALRPWEHHGQAASGTRQLPDWVFAQPERSERDEFGYPRVDVDKAGLSALLRARAFDSLTGRLAAYQRDFVRDFRNEYRLMNAYGVFERSDPGLESLLNEWVSRAPESPEARLARALYRHSRGWDARGTRWRSETPDENVARMRDWMRAARTDAEQVLARDSVQIVAYTVLLKVEQAMGADYDAASLILRRGLRISPRAMLLRDYMMDQLMPKWGGSFEAMERFFAAAAEPHVQDNPRLRVLRGRIHRARGDELDDDDKYDAAIREYTKALSYGHSAAVRFDRGRAYHQNDKHLEALADFNAAWVDSPDWPDLLDWRGWTYHMLAYRAVPAQRDRLRELALRDLAHAHELEPSDRRARDLAFVRRCRAEPARC